MISGTEMIHFLVQELNEDYYMSIKLLVVSFKTFVWDPLSSMQYLSVPGCHVIRTLPFILSG